MRREVLIAIILGVGLGVAVAFGVWRANLALNSKSPSSSSNSITDQAQGNDTSKQSNLILTEPDNNSVVTQDKVTIKGSSTPKAVVTISSNSDDDIVVAGTDGSFQKEISLASGPNDIVVKSYDDQGNESQQKITLVYSAEVAQ